MTKSQISVIVGDTTVSINFEIGWETRFVSLKQEIATVISLHRDFFSIFTGDCYLRDFDIIHSSKVFMDKKAIRIETNRYFEGISYLKKLPGVVSIDLKFSRIVQIDMLEELMLFQMTKHGNDSFSVLENALKAYVVFGGNRHFPVKLANRLGFVGLGDKINSLKTYNKFISTEI